MNIYNHTPADLQLWQTYAEFHLRFCAGFWSPGLVMRPYGVVQLAEEGDWGDLLWKLNPAHGWSVDDIIRDVENLSARNLKSPGFYFNAAFDRALAEQLQTALPQHGYTLQRRVLWLVLNNLPAQAPSVPQGFTMRDATDAEAFLKLQHNTFPEDHMDDFYRTNIPTPRSMVNVRILNLLDNAGTPAAMGAMAWEGEVGYLFCLGVRSDLRRQGLGKLMVDWRLHALKQNGVKHVVTAVLAENDSSYNLQRQQGYRHFATAESWLR